MSVNEVLARVGEIRARLELPQLRTNFAPAAPLAPLTPGSLTAGSQFPATSATDFEATLANMTGQLPKPAGTGLMSADPDLGRRMAEYGVNFVGVPYVAGGNTPDSGWDCASKMASRYHRFPGSRSRLASRWLHLVKRVRVTWSFSTSHLVTVVTLRLSKSTTLAFIWAMAAWWKPPTRPAIPELVK